MNNPLNIEIGKEYPASRILDEIEKCPTLDITLGHVIIHYEKENKHDFYVRKEKLKKLKETPLKVLLITSKPNCKNFASNLLKNKEIMEFLEIIKQDKTKVCILDKSDLINADCKNKDMSKAVTLINSVFKSNRMTFKASSCPDGIKISYKNIDVKKE